jgi:hypothetical protein
MGGLMKEALVHHVGVTTMKSLDQSSLHSLIKGLEPRPPRWESKELVSPLVIADYCEPLHTILPLSETGRRYMKAAGELLDQQIRLHTRHKFKRRSNCEKCRNKISMYSIYLR